MQCSDAGGYNLIGVYRRTGTGRLRWSSGGREGKGHGGMRAAGGGPDLLYNE
jgi:hypothetical protein